LYQERATKGPPTAKTQTQNPSIKIAVCTNLTFRANREYTNVKRRKAPKTAHKERKPCEDTGIIELARINPTIGSRGSVFE
jgi:hypothetical protein